MFVSHLSSFLVYVNVSASVQHKNRLARDKSFLAIPYGPDGKVFFAAVNFPGSWADGALTARFLHALKNKIGEYKICVDQSFPRSGEAYGTLVGPVTKWAARRLHRGVREYLLRISNVHTSLRQASKWGMCGLQGTFPHWKKRRQQ
jgi:hypothetical protein